MKKYTYPFLTSALVLASLTLGQSAKALDVHEPTSPQQKASNVGFTLEGNSVRIDYSRSTVQKNFTIYHAVWSDEGGQDDLVWYPAPQSSRTSVNLAQHKGYGKFHVHTYIDINGKMVGLNGGDFTLNKPPQNQSIQIEGTNLTVQYPRNKDQANSLIQHSVWSNDNGKDDLKTYTASGNSTTINLKDHTGYGTYFVNTSIVENGKTTSLAESKFNIEQPNLKLQSTISETGLLDIRITNVPSHIYEILLPTWSENKGQDDIKWYAATKNPDGSYSLRVQLKDHHFDTGSYHIHCYAKSHFKQEMHGLSSTSTTITSSHIPSTEEMKPSMTISNIQANQGRYDISIQETNKSKKIKSVQVPVWSKSDQSNIKWYDATNHGNGRFSTQVDFKLHQYHSATYFNHVYITYEDGSRVGYVLNEVNLTSAYVPMTVNSRFVSSNNFQVTIENALGSGNVVYAVWSDENDQDDLKWYTASKKGVGLYEGTISLQNHTGVGRYHLHVYQDGRGVPTTFQVEANHRTNTLKTYPVTEANTYPQGECTWGAKELAPWIPNWLGNAGGWTAAARNKGFRTGTTPQVGAIICWTDGGAGHVGVVIEVQSNNRIQIKEANYAGRRYVGNFRGWFDPQRSVTPGQVTYIYPKY